MGRRRYCAGPPFLTRISRLGPNVSESYSSPAPGLRLRLEHAFESWGEVVCRHPWVVIIIALSLSALPISQLPKLVIEPNPETFLDPLHPTRTTYEEFKHDFGQDQSVLVVLRPDAPFSHEFLSVLRDLHRGLEDEVPFVDEVNSLINARVTRGERDGLTVDDLFEEWPESDEALARIRDYALANRVYEGTVLNAEHRLVMLAVVLSAYGGDSDALGGFEDEEEFLTRENREFLRVEERNEAIEGVKQVMSRVLPAELETHLIGVPVMEDQVTTAMMRNMARFTALALIAMLALLFLLFRRPSGVLIPPAVALLAVMSAFGAGGALGVPLKMGSQLLPSMLMAISISSTLHILVLFFAEFDRSGMKSESIRYALGHSGVPIVFASLTTAGGLISFAMVELSAIRDVGQLGPLGIATQIFLTLALTPALLRVLPLKQRRSSKRDNRDGTLERLLVWCADISVAHSWKILLIGLVLTCAAGTGAFRLVYVFDPLEFVPKSYPLYVSTQLMNEELRAVGALEVLIDTGEENGLHAPEFLAALERLHSEIPGLSNGTEQSLEVGKVLSFVDILREIHQALNENRPEFYTVPSTRPLAAQELLLFENTGADDLEDFVDPQFSRARVTISIPWVAPSELGTFLPDAERAFRSHLGPDVGIVLTGFIDLIAVIERAVRSVLFSSYFIAILIITPLMMFLIGSLRGGLASMIPNLSPIIAAIGFMGWANIDLNIFTIIAGGIALGIAVDDTIHVFHQFHRYFAACGDTREALRNTLRTTGRALLTTSTVLSTGFLVYTVSGLPGLTDLGMVTALAVSLAFLADAFMAPALLHLLYRSRQSRIE